ncbi:hypothetical protein QBC38DRAFT_194212 [Podospora fimiseda]|uniref:RRM domain-containing protein n=1 Tax=Podospora fimiseda TaxID=252190 RepID=A0AAN7BPJ2_9PEZI|nr:hypothetical protein QBC38DRAFT_194212 [Podospora fimiseda]
MGSRSRSREPIARDDDPGQYRTRSRGRSPTQTPGSNHSRQSRSPSVDGRRNDYRSRSPARNGRHHSPSRSRSRSRDHSQARSDSRGRSWSRSRSRSRTPRSPTPPFKSTKIVVERLTKNVNEDHLKEIFGQYGEIEDLDLPVNRTSGTNRGTAYILYYDEAGAESAITHMHEAQIDGAVINVSIVLPVRKMSPAPPTARHGANINPRNPRPTGRSGPQGSSMGGGGSGRGGQRSGRHGNRSDTYRPRSVSRSRSRSPLPPSNSSRRHRSRSYSSVSRSRSRTPPPRGGQSGRDSRTSGRRYDDRRSMSVDSYNGRG